MRNHCPRWNSNPISSAYEVNALTVALLDLISIEYLKVDRVLSEFAILNLRISRGRCSKMICCVFLPYDYYRI